MLDDILKQIQGLKQQKGKINEEIIRLTDVAAAEMRNALRGDRRPRQKKGATQ
jgi:hypothetical protein